MDQPDREPLNPQAPVSEGPSLPYTLPTSSADTTGGAPAIFSPFPIPGAIRVDGQVMVPAGLWPRVGAFLLDFLILSLLGQLLTLLTGITTPEDTSLLADELLNVLSGARPSAEMLELQASLATLALLQTLMCAAYFTFFYAFTSTSLGKMVFGLQVRATDGQPLTPGQSLWRYVAYWLSAKLLYSFWMIPFEREQRTLHDLLARTNVFKPLEAAERGHPSHLT